MLIEKLPYYGYLSFLKRFRVFLLFVVAALLIASVLYIKKGFVYDDKSLWINGSDEYSKLLALNHPSLNIEKVVVDVSSDGWGVKAIEKLKFLQLQLMEKEHVIALNTLFKQTSIFNNSLSDEQSMTEIITLFDVDNNFIFQEVEDNPAKFRSFVNGDRVTFYIVSDGIVSLSEFKCSYPYERSKIQSSAEVKDILLFSILLIVLAISFSIAFKSFLPTMLGAVFIVATTILTVALFQLISPVKETHISIVLLAVTVSVMDFVYIYYKWHVLHRNKSHDVVLYRVLTKTFVPIFWTTTVTALGIGSLIFVDSHILHSMGLNVALSSSVGFVFSFTLLPVMLTFFEPNKPEIITQDSAKFFAAKEAKYKTTDLNIFLLFSALVLVYGSFMYIYKPINVVTDTSATQIQLGLTHEGMSIETLDELKNIQNTLKVKFKEIDSIESAYTEIKKLYKQEHKGEPFVLANVDVDSYSFMFDLYDITDKIMINDHLILNIYLHDTTEKAQILSFIRDKNILIQDLSSLLQVAKMDSINTLFLVVFFVLVLIMSIIYYMTRTLEFVWIALLVNALPLSWFFAVTMLLDIAISTEMLVAMIITVALSSDATMHFIFYYYNNRFKPRNAVQSLESSFLYIGTPLGMGNIILILVFIALIFVPDTTISNIGIYSSLLVSISLIMELFVLPVLFLSRIKGNSSIKGYGAS
ncbi:MAG: hypothetical protein GQ570_05015 [Helicobacteraceae bacterium]|nr:hypothetical protein [Helicobacteraceae bacterium]